MRNFILGFFMAITIMAWPAYMVGTKYQDLRYTSFLKDQALDACNHGMEVCHEILDGSNVLPPPDFKSPNPDGAAPAPPLEPKDVPVPKPDPREPKIYSE